MTTLVVHVITLGGHACTVSVDGPCTGARLKSEIHRSLGIPCCEQRLFVSTDMLDDGDQLEDFISSEGESDAASIALICRSNKQADWLQAVKWGEKSLEAAPPEIRDDREIVMAAVGTV